MQMSESILERVNTHMLANYNARSNAIWCYVGMSGTGQHTFIRPYSSHTYMVGVTVNRDDTASIGVYKCVEEVRI